MLVNDGSTDSRRYRIMEITENENVAGINFTRNFGKKATNMDGIDIRTGDATPIISWSIYKILLHLTKFQR